MKPKDKNKTCPDALSNECIVWQGGDVPVLGIYDGQVVSEAEFIIANKILELFDNQDMSEVDMHCLEATCAQKCKDTSLKAIVQVLFDNQCCLADLIASFSAAPAVVTININLRCLNQFDDFGNVLPQDLNQSLQSIVNQVCTSVTDITSLKAGLQELQTQVDAIPTTVPTFVEPTITTCLTAGLRPTSQTVPLVAQVICDYQTAFGAATDAQIAVSQQCPNLNSTYTGTQGWLTSVNNLAQSFNNLWILACDINTRLINIEKNCCKATCDDVKIGFGVTVSTTANGLILNFTSGAGTSIPAGFTDTGSTVVFTDKNNQTVTYPLVISNNAKQGPFDLTGLDQTDPISISVTAILSTDGLTCEKCVTKLYSLANTTCPVCPITTSGTTGTITIIFSTTGSFTNLQELILGPNQTGYIPTNATILGISTNGDVTADSQCIDLTPPPSVCYTFTWVASDFDDGQSVLANAFFSQVALAAGALTYTINSGYFNTGPGIPNCSAGCKLITAINATVPAAVMQANCALVDTPPNATISASVPQTLGVPILQISIPNDSNNATDFLYLVGIKSTNSSDCDCNQSSNDPGHPVA